MGRTNFSAVQVGTTSANMGLVGASQTGTISQTAAGTTNLTFTLPASSRIIDIIADVTTAYDSVTSATLTVGRTSGGTELASGVNVKTAGRTRPTFTNTQLANMADITTNTSVVATVVSVGTTSTGTVRVTIIYATDSTT